VEEEGWVENMSSVTFLGTAGGRVVVLNQLRHSGGIWFELDGVNILQDPGPGCLVRCHQHHLKPPSLEAIILSHRHIDHSNDVNIMIEAMTRGGFHPKGQLIVPEDCLESDPVILQYVRPYVKITKIKEGLIMDIQMLTAPQSSSFDEPHISEKWASSERDTSFPEAATESQQSRNYIKVKFPIRHHHTVETYGAIYEFSGGRIGYIPDTLPFPELAKAYTGVDLLILNVVRMRGDDRIAHLTMKDARNIIEEAKPKKAVLTHFGMQVLKASPNLQAKIITGETGIETIAAHDGLKVVLGKPEESLERFLG
jgi:ribonuclease BN (tRNA processing enzyme)